MSKQTNTKKDFLILLLLSSILSFASGYIYFSSSSIDTVEIRGVYNSFDYMQRTTNTTSKMQLNLKNSDFIIPSYLEASFMIDDFNREVVKGDSILIFVDNDDFLYQIKSKDKLFFEEEKRDSLIKQNNKIALIVGLVFLVISILALAMFIKK